MKKEKYESPKFDFQEMKLMEKVADTCWGLGYGWFDANDDGVHDPQEIIDFNKLPGNTGGDNGKCTTVAENLITYMNVNYTKEVMKKLGRLVEINDVKQNSQSTLVEPLPPS